jgi:hypothetical protein
MEQKEEERLVKKIFSILTVLLVPFVFVILLYGVTMNQKELFPGGGYLFAVAANLSEAYVASFIFFYIVQYLPWNKNHKSSKHKVMYLLLRLKFDIKNLIIYLLKLSDYNYTDEILDYDSTIEIPKNIHFDLTKRCSESLYIGSVCQYFIEPKVGIEVAVICIENCLKNLKEYFIYQDDDLNNILTDICISEFMESFKNGIRSEALLKKVIDTRAYELNQFIRYYRNLSRYIEKNYADKDMEIINQKVKESQEFQNAFTNDLLERTQNGKGTKVK